MKLLQTLALALFVPIVGYCQDATTTPGRNAIVSSFETEVKTLTSAYDKKIAELDAAYASKIKALRMDAVAKLKNLQKVVAADDLDEAIAIRDTVEELTEAKASDPRKESVESSLHDSKLRELEKVKTELREKLSAIEKLIGYQSLLTNQVIGKTYRITIGGSPRTWTFGPNGVLIVNGEPSPTRWIAFGNDGIICAGADNGNIDICQFSDGGATIEVIYVGDFKKYRTRHPGKLVPQ